MTVVPSRVVVVTGANVGIGLETAAGLAAVGATTVLACRNPVKAESAAADVRARASSDDVHTVALDLADLASVRACARELEARFEHIDVLVNNAGGILQEQGRTAQGFEKTFGVNYLGPFLLTNLLLERLVRSAEGSGDGRVVNVASVAHHWAKLDWDDLQTTRRYRPFKAYGRSKLADILFTRALAARLAGTAVTANALHPGNVRSGFGMDGDLRGYRGLGVKIYRPAEISPAAGARTSIYLASSAEMAGKSGGYYVRCKPGHPSRRARSHEDAARLWRESERLVADAGFPIP